MPHITIDHTVSNYADGDGNSKFLIDLSKELSGLYGKLIRQGQIFKVNSIHVGVYNPNTTVQDEALSAGGILAYYHPTGNRKAAWKNAFTAVQRLRQLGGVKSDGYDFRVGFRGNTGWQEVDFGAWVRDEDEPLVLGYDSDGQNSIFTVWNDRLVDASQPVDPDYDGFGTPFDTPGVLADDLDYTDNDNQFYQEGGAPVTYQMLPFQAAAAGVFDSGVFQAGSTMAPGWTTTNQVQGPIWAMCGLIGVDVTTTIPDDTTAQTQDVGIRVTVDVESWEPIIKRRKSRGKRSRRK